MRRRTPGYYVSVRVKAGGVLPGELLDGPWATRDSAEARLRTIAAARAGRAECAIVRIEDDGVTVSRDPD